MDWKLMGAIAVAFMVAAGAGKLAELLVSSEAHKKTARSVAITLVVVAFFSWFNNTGRPDRKAQRVQAQFDKIVNESVPLSMVREHLPESMDEFRDYLLIAIKENHSDADIEDNTRQIMARYLIEKLPKASDEAVLYTIRLSLEQMQLLYERDDDSCFKYLFPEIEGGIRAEQVFSEELMSRDIESIRLILSSYDATRADPDEASAMTNLNLVYSELLKEFSETELGQLDDVEAQDVDRSKICLMSIGLYSNILAMPETEAITTLRWMFK